MSQAERVGGGTWCLFSQCSCFGDRGSVPVAWRERASHLTKLINSGEVRVKQRRAGAGWWAGRHGAITVSDLSFCLVTKN